jgi:hypothetical protein
MLAIILHLFRFVELLGSRHQAVAVENLALRLQLAAYKRKHRRPVVMQWDRLFWVGLSQVWSRWRRVLIFVQPDTVVRWQRERFRRFWALVRNNYVRAHAAIFSNQYSWCNPPSTALRRTRWPAGSRCRCSEWGGDRLSGAGIPGPRLI